MTFHLSTMVVAMGIVALASLLSPDGKQKRWVNFVFGLVAFSVISIPILSFKYEEFEANPPSFSTSYQVEGSPFDYVLSFGEEELKKQLCTTFSLLEEEVDLALTVEEGKAPQASVTLSDTTKGEGILLYLQQLLGKEWEVKVIGR